MNVYDFDGTIYDGDSTVDFLKFMYRRHPSVILPFAFSQCAAVAAFFCRKISRQQMKETCFAFLTRIENTQKTVADFWDEHECKIKEWYLKQQKEDDVIISASPEFLLKEICDRRQIRYLIATEMDPHSGKIQGKNCRGEEKTKRFSDRFPNERVERFYSDHSSDLYMARLADAAWIVKGNEIKPWEN